MSTNDELLAGLDLMVADGWKWPKLGAAAIRELEAKLDAERKARDEAERTVGLCYSAINDLEKEKAAIKQHAVEAEARAANIDAELKWMSEQWDDSIPSHELTHRLYDVSCTAKKLLQGG